MVVILSEKVMCFKRLCYSERLRDDLSRQFEYM